MKGIKKKTGIKRSAHTRTGTSRAFEYTHEINYIHAYKDVHRLRGNSIPASSKALTEGSGVELSKQS